jgi:ABC-type multidrug transport system fused ATPase/permease subunit
MMAVVSQDTYLFPVSIAENISYGRPGASMDEIEKTAVSANAHDFIMELPDGYDTLVGERGVKLSGGQRQRLSIARAMLKDAPLLILDEPASNLDNQSEALVQEALEKAMKGKTVIVIAHRLSTIKNADEIFVIEEGKVDEHGSHRQLMEKGGLYRKLYVSQSAEEGSLKQTTQKKECIA